MALVVISGQPCSGKSTVAAAVEQLLGEKGLEVIVIDEPSLSMKRNESYKGKVPLTGMLVQRPSSQASYAICSYFSNAKTAFELQTRSVKRTRGED